MLGSIGSPKTGVVHRRGRTRANGQRRPLRCARWLGFELLEDRRLLATTANASVESYLYVGDQGDPNDSTDDSVQQFDATTGAYLGKFAVPGRLIGPRGLVLSNPETLLTVNQNVNQPFAGEVLRFDARTGAELAPLVPAFLPSGAANPSAPFAPRGAVIRDNVLYIADVAEGSSNGRIAKYDATNGKFMGNLLPAGFPGDFRPRGLLFGPDDQLYVTLFSLNAAGDYNPLAGYVMRLNPTSGSFVFIASNDGDNLLESGEVADLHRPEGLAFGPDGRLYVTSFRADSNDTNKILVLDPVTRKQKDAIVLDQAGQPEAFAEAIAFGPDGRLFAPITGDGPASGSVRRYDVATKSFDDLVAPSVGGGPLAMPWYLTFSRSRQDTMEYDAYSSPWHNPVNPLDVDGQGGVLPLDALIIINYINAHPGNSSLPASPSTGPPYYDVAQRGFVSALDVLLVVNYIDGRGSISSPEGEAAPSYNPTSWPLSQPSTLPSSIAAASPNRSAATMSPEEETDETTTPEDEMVVAHVQAYSFDALWTSLDDLLTDLAVDAGRPQRP